MTRVRSVTIIAFGDSLTAGYGVSQSEAYPAQLESALREAGFDVRVVNSGVSGETTRGNAERAQFIRSQEPDFVILGIGGNDALRALPLDETEKNIRQTIDILQSGEQAPRVLLLQMQAPLNAGKEYKDTFDGLYETIATEKNLLLVPFITEEIFLDQDNKLPDGIHYNQVGYQKVVEEHILPAVQRVLNERVDDTL
jgi:acyl-CoA thioesterase-1